MEVWWGVFWAGCSCVWWGFPAPFEAQLAFCTVAWQTWKVYGSEGAIQLCIASCNCPALPSHAEKLMDFPWLRNALQEESEVVHKQVSYRKQVVYFCQLPIFWSNWIRFKIKVEMQSFFQKSYPNLGDATPNQPINQWIRNQKIPVGGRGSHQELDRRVWRHGSSSLAATDAGGGSHYFPRLKSRVGMVVSFEESFFLVKNKGCFVWSWVVGLLVCWLCCIWRRSFWLKDFFQKIIAPDRPSSSKKKKHVLGQWTCFSPSAKKSVKESSLDRTASCERMHMESPKEWLEIVQSPKHISYLLLEKSRTVTSDLRPQNCLLVRVFFHFRLL